MADQLTVDHKELARRAYWNRYGPVTGHKNFVGSPMPDFDNLPETQQRAWGQAIDLPVEDINALLQLKNSCDREAISDGYHTFSELYDHRIVLFATLARRIAAEGQLATHPVWRSELHDDNTMFTGYFIAGIGLTPGSMITYHISLEWWDTFNFATKIERAPKWDGHTSKDVIKRLLAL